MKKKTAKLIKDNLPGFGGHAALYKVSPPIDGHKFVIASAATMFGGETYLFPAVGPKTVCVSDWSELSISQKGTLSHSKVFKDAGYKIVK